MTSVNDARVTRLLRVAAISLCLSLGLISNVIAGNETAPAQKTTSGQDLFAKVGDREITLEEYQQSYARTVRQRYYHSKPPEGELATVRQEIGDELITRQLLLLEAERSGIQPDQRVIEEKLERYDQRYAGSPRWQQERARLLGALKVKLEQDDLVRQMESKVKNIPPPGDEQLKAYYERNLDKFTEPLRMKLSLILLVVDPSSSAEIWQAAMDAGQELVRQLRDGSDFAELARTYSGDTSAEQGGDMGYVHKEMLSASVQEVVDRLQPGHISDAFRTLQGVAILRLDDTQPERLRDYEDVRDRARGLWLREQSETAWSEFKQKLRRDTPVTVFVDVANSNNDV